MIRIDHIGIPARGRLDAASFLTRIFGLDRAIPGGLYFRTPDGHLFEVMSLASVAGTT